MPVIVFGLDGAEALTLRVDDAPDFSPFEGKAEEIDAGFFWGMLPDDLDDMPASDRELVESAWRSMIQYAAAAMTEVAHLDQTASLLNFPIRRPRRWLKLALVREEDISQGSPLLLDDLPGRPGARLLQTPDVAAQTTLETAQDASAAGAYVALDYSVSEKARNQCTLSFRLASLYPRTATPSLVPPPALSGEGEGWFFFGYGDGTQSTLAPGAYAAVSTQGRLAAVLVHADASASWAVCAETLSLSQLDEGITLTLEYFPLSSGETQARATAESIDVSVVADAAFRAKTVSLVGADTRIAPRPPYSGVFGEDARVSFSVVTDSINWTDTSLPSDARVVPSLMTKVLGFSDRLVAGIDYVVAWDDEKEWAELRLVSTPTSDMWAEWVGFDSRLLEQFFGAFVGIPTVSTGPDTLEFKNKLAALLYGLLAGPQVGPLTAAVSALAGVPVALEGGVVTSVGTADVVPAIVVRGFSQDRLYRYPPELNPLVSVGDRVEKFDLLVEHPTIMDWTSGREFTDALRLNTSDRKLFMEAQKFSAVQIDIPYGSLGVAREDEGSIYSLPNQIREYLDKALPLWCGALKVFLTLVKRVEDQLDMLDSQDWEGVLSVLTPLTNARDPRYNDSRGFRYDGSLLYNEAEYEVLKGRLSVAAENTSGAPVTVHILGTDVTIPAGGTVTIDEPV